MTRAHSKLNSSLIFLNQAAAVTASIATVTRANARLAGWVAGLLYIMVASIDVVTGDEGYVFTLAGRPVGGNYAPLATLKLGGATLVAAGTHVAGVVGLWVVDVPRFAAQMKLDLTIAGTTPSIMCSAFAVAQDQTYGPDYGTVITD